MEVYLDPVALVGRLLSLLPLGIEATSSLPDCRRSVKRKIALLGSIQFSGVIHEARKLMAEKLVGDEIVLPQRVPLTPGETLGCTSPIMDTDIDICIFVADGRFHIESAMIQNTHIRSFYRFDPFLKVRNWLVVFDSFFRNCSSKVMTTTK